MVIIDTSVVFKWFSKTEDNRQIAKNILEKHLLGQNEITVPDLLLYEITNAWTTKTKVDLSLINKNLLALKNYSLNIMPINFNLLKKASEFSVKYKVSVYDAVYAVLAKEKKCNLITADIKFTKKISLSFIKSLDQVIKNKKI